MKFNFPFSYFTSFLFGVEIMTDNSESAVVTFFFLFFLF
jgi:hypothetical protein